jgi:signal transduction histidine kinase
MGRRESAPLIVATAMCVAGPGMAALLVNDHVYEEVGEPRVGVAHGAEIVLAIGVVGLVFSAAITFARACSRQHDATLGMIGTAAVLLGAAWTCDLVAPARGTQWVSGRELLRVLAYGCLAVAAVRRRSALQRAEQEKAVLDERRRLIDDLHDGLAQDLAFLVTQADTRLGTDDSVAVVARRALAGARGAIADLSAATAPTAAAALETIADELSARHGVDVTVDADDVALPPRERYAVTRIAREAIVNAVQHGAARRVAVSLAADDAALRLTVHDDGRGMGRAAADDPLRGYGLRAMRERAEAIHGRLIAASGTDGGTDIQLMVPRH